MRAEASARRRRAERQGRKAERLAAFWLRLKGYRVLARGYRTPFGEVDLIVKRGRVIVFVEVKIRPDLASAAEAISLRQRTRIRRAAEHFLAHRGGGEDARFDAILIAPGQWPRHIHNAWDD